MNKYIVYGLIILTGIWCAPVFGDTSSSDQIVVDRTTRNKILNDYAILTRDVIQRAWTTPTDISAPGALKGKVGINYTIKRSGALAKVELIKGSGNAEMDKSLLATIRSAAPFPPFPEGINADKIMIRANFLIADLPVTPVVQINHEIKSKDPLKEVIPEPYPKKFIWGLPARSAAGKNQGDQSPLPPAPPQNKYKWGADTD